MPAVPVQRQVQYLNSIALCAKEEPLRGIRAAYAESTITVYQAHQFAQRRLGRRLGACVVPGHGCGEPLNLAVCLRTVVVFEADPFDTIFAEAVELDPGWLYSTSMPKS